MFQKIDEPTPPGSRGLGEFLSDVDNKMLNEHRDRLKAVTLEDVKRVGGQYLGGAGVRGVTVIGPEPPKDLDSTWTVSSLSN